MPEQSIPVIDRVNAPRWLDLDALVSEELVADLEAVKAEAEALAPTVREFAIRAWRATHAFEEALRYQQLPDEVWEATKDACGAEAAFEALRTLIDDLQVARGEKPERERPEWLEQEEANAAQCLGPLREEMPR